MKKAHWVTFVRLSLLLAIPGCGDPMGGTENGQLILLWHNGVSASVNSFWRGTPAIAGGRLFIEDGNRAVALDATSGSVIWSTPVKVFPTPGTENVVVRDGRVFISEVDSVSALSAADGSVLWRFHPDSNAALVGSSADDRAVYTGQRGVPIVYAIGVSTGLLLWRVNVAQGWTTPAFVTGVAVSGDTVFAGISRWINQNGGVSTGVVVALNRITGTELWRYETPTQSDDMQGLPVVAGDALIVNDFYGGALIALDRATGRERWRVPSVGAGFGPLGPTVVVGDHVYLGSEDNFVYDISLATGQVAWRQNTGGSVDAVSFCGGSVWANNGRLERRNATDGRLTGHFNAAGLFTSHIATDGSNVFLTGQTGVYAIRCG